MHIGTGSSSNSNVVTASSGWHTASEDTKFFLLHTFPKGTTRGAGGKANDHGIYVVVSAAASEAATVETGMTLFMCVQQVQSRL